jgi:hypothetical protein
MSPSLAGRFFLPVNHGAASACGCPGIAAIGQLADVGCREGRDDGQMEIRIILDRVEPPAGRLRVLPGPGRAHRSGARQEIRFTGWLGLLRALYEVTGAPGGPSAPEP